MKILWLAIVALCLLAASGSAVPVKVALVMGNNRGDAQEVELLYSQSDAQRLSWVLQRYGGFRAENITVLLEGTATDAEKALISINDRIRLQLQDSSHEFLLFV